MAPACQEETSVCRLLPAKAVSLNSEKGCVVPRLWEPARGDSCSGHCGHREAWPSKAQTDLATLLDGDGEQGFPSVPALLVQCYAWLWVKGYHPSPVATEIQGKIEI